MNTQQVLPILAQEDQIVQAVLENQVILIKAETGSGKSTQIPQFLCRNMLENCPGIIACTQPRRLAAVELATRVAHEQNSSVGDVVGYVVRGDRKVSDNTTRIVYITEGCLIREFMGVTYEYIVSKYRCILLDEVHEQTTNMIILLGMLRDVLSAQPKFRLIITSATMDVGVFHQFFAQQVPEIIVPGRNFPVIICYAKNNVMFSHAASECADAVLLVTKSTFDGDGDFLVFLHGEKEIKDCCRLIREGIRDTEFSNDKVYPLYASLPQSEIDAAVNACKTKPTSSSGNRRSRNIIVASNVAETSITLLRVIIVFDSGLAKEKVK